MVAQLNGNEILTTTFNTQVYQATHNGEGTRLPYYARSFISFTYGGKAIEDFGLIVITDGDRISRDAYSTFSDIVESLDTIDGQLYWGSRLEAKKLELKLATDGITDNQLTEFKKWFSPEKSKELILSEHPNRAIMARIAAPPKLELLPFEKDTTLIINNQNYDVKTTVYRGEVVLTFVMDKPYWYSKLTYMPSYINKVTLEKLDINDNNINKIETINDKDMLKIMLEDGIPHQSILQKELFLGDNYLVTSEARTDFSRTDNTNNASAYLGKITRTSPGLSIDNDANDDSQKYLHLFYSGTARSYPTIQFELLPQHNDYYIHSPENNFPRMNNNNNILPYSYILVTANGKEQIFKFTTPSILTSYNQMIKIFKTCNGKTTVEIKKEINETIKHYYTRAWAIGCVTTFEASVTTITEESGNKSLLMEYGRKFINENQPMKFLFNSATGEAKGTFFIALVDNNNITSNDIVYTEIIENVGDMILSKYLVLEERNYLNANGELENLTTISSNENLSNFLIFFDNMYY